MVLMHKSALASAALGITNAVVVPFGFKFPCTQETYVEWFDQWLARCEQHTITMMIAKWNAIWYDGFCTITYSDPVIVGTAI